MQVTADVTGLLVSAQDGLQRFGRVEVGIDLQQRRLGFYKSDMLDPMPKIGLPFHIIGADGNADRGGYPGTPSALDISLDILALIEWSKLGNSQLHVESSLIEPLAFYNEVHAALEQGAGFNSLGVEAGFSRLMA